MKRAPQKTFNTLLMEIDHAVEEHKQRIYKDSNIHLDRLLHELETYHPLNRRIRRHGQRLVDELFGEEDISVMRCGIEAHMRSAFQLPYRSQPAGAVSRDISRIFMSFSEPFIFIGEKLGILYAILREIRGK